MTTSTRRAALGVKRKITVDIKAVRRKATDDLDEAEVEFGFESDNEMAAASSRSASSRNLLVCFRMVWTSGSESLSGARVVQRHIQHAR
jgi:hypothetical protein